jgi:alkylation response protein AidB-like acyl-CoA dehydrogenase
MLADRPEYRPEGKPMVRQLLIDRMAELKKTPPLGRIDGIREALAKAGDEAQELRRLPDWVIPIMVDAGLFRIAMPTELAGEDLLACDQIEIIEACTAIDGSVGWCVQINSEINALVLRQMDPKLAHIICDDWDMIVSSGLGTPNEPTWPRKARREGDGWRLDYQGAFASGCWHATWNMVLNPGAEVIDEETGKPADATWMLPKGEFEVVDTWHMAGMRGSGSHDVRVVNKVVPREHLLPMNALASTRLYENPTLRNPIQVPYNKAAVALGVAKGAIDELIKLALHKTPWMAGSALKDLPDMQVRLGECIASYEAAKAYLLESQREIEANLGPLKGGREMPEWPLYRKGLMASTWAAQESRRITDLVCSTAGTTALRSGHPLERKSRDARQAAAHGGTSWRHLSNMAKTYIGTEPPMGYGNVTRA